MTKTEYKKWLNDDASQDCTKVDSLYVKNVGETGYTITDNGEICDFLNDATQSDVDDLEELKFSGTDVEGPWEAIDELEGTDIIRVTNTGNVPVKIKRPTGT